LDNDNIISKAQTLEICKQLGVEIFASKYAKLPKFFFFLKNFVDKYFNIVPYHFKNFWKLYLKDCLKEIYLQ
jgi:hypothetical protein